MTTTSIPQTITFIRANDQGMWDMHLSSLGTADLRRALAWATHNDPNIAVVIEDELDYREDPQ